MKANSINELLQRTGIMNRMNDYINNYFQKYFENKPEKYEFIIRSVYCSETSPDLISIVYEFGFAEERHTYDKGYIDELRINLQFLLLKEFSNEIKRLPRIEFVEFYILFDFDTDETMKMEYSDLNLVLKQMRPMLGNVKDKTKHIVKEFLDDHNLKCEKFVVVAVKPNVLYEKDKLIINIQVGFDSKVYNSYTEIPWSEFRQMKKYLIQKLDNEFASKITKNYAKRFYLYSINFEILFSKL